MSNKNSAANINSRMFRDVMGLFATGVTVVTSDLEGETHGMTANAITSLSLNPLMVLVCVQKDAMMASILQRAKGFAINILNEDQEQLSNFFAGIWPEGADPPFFSFEPWVGGGRLHGVIGALACKIDKFLDGGDHWIITGLVVDLYRQEAPVDPLIYYTGRYHRLSRGGA
ncbi:MAG: flavin reductase [Anaerolineae bacterium]|nr:flavin reductase [Anaerolineae bacterium]